MGEEEFIVGEMREMDHRTNELLALVVERFQFHSDKAKSDDPVIVDMAAKICKIEIWEMWALTQR